MTDLIEEIQRFIDTYFLTEDFNPVNTVIYSIILLIGVLFIYKLIIKFNYFSEERWGSNYRIIAPDNAFFMAITPYILLGGAVRAFNDAFITPPHLLLSEPWIFLVITVYTMIVGFLSILSTIRFNKDYRVMFCAIGIISLLIVLIPLLLAETSEGIRGIQNWEGLIFSALWQALMVMIFLFTRNMKLLQASITILVLGCVLVLVNVILSEKAFITLEKMLVDSFLILLVIICFTAALFIYEKKFAPEQLGLMNEENLLTISGQMWDTIVTVVSISFFGYSEQNLLPEFLIKSFGTWLFFAVKLIIVTMMLVILDRWWDNKDQRNWIKFLIYVLGLATGTRNFLRMITST